MIEASASQAATVSEDELPWKTRVEEPGNRFLYYPMARRLVDWLKHTSVTPNQVTLIQPFIAALAAYLITFEDWRYMLAGVVVFETRSMLDCADGTLARAKKMSSPNGHALDAICDWLGVVLLYAGIYTHFVLHPPPAGEWSAYLPMGTIIALSLLQGAFRSLAADYYLRKFGSIFADGRDSTVEDLRDKQLALTSKSAFWARVDAWIGRCQHLALQQEIFDAEQTPSLTRRQLENLMAERHSPLARLVAKLWSISSGDFYIRLTVISVALGHAWMWKMQLFWASFGVVWIIATVVLTTWFFRRSTEMAPAEVEA